jgi:hypothetical protein
VVLLNRLLQQQLKQRRLLLLLRSKRLNLVLSKGPCNTCLLLNSTLSLQCSLPLRVKPPQMLPWSPIRAWSLPPLLLGLLHGKLLVAHHKPSTMLV